MQITTNLNQLISNLNSGKKLEPVNKCIVTDTNKTPTASVASIYDVRNMSPNEFKVLISDLRDSGQITMDDALMLSVERYYLERFDGGTANDKKIDLVAYFEEQIEIMKSTPESKGVEFQEWTLNLLKAIEAKGKAQAID